MSRFRRILVYADHQQPAALDRVVAMARQHEAELSVCDVVPPPPAYLGDDPTVEQIQRAQLQFAFARLRQFCARHMDAINGGFTVLTGSPYLAVIQQVIQSQVDLLVHLRDPAKHSGLDSTLAHFARKCPSPVWHLPAIDSGANAEAHEESAQPQEVSAEAQEVSAQPQEVIVALDRAAQSGEPFGSEMAANCLRTARALLPEGGTLHLVHAWRPYGSEWLQRPDTPLDGEGFASYIETQRAAYEAWFAAAVAEIEAALPSGLSLEANLYEGELKSALARFAPNECVPLVVGTVSAEAPRGLLIGSHSEDLLVEGQRELVLVKPGAYVSPLQIADANAAPESGDNTHG